MVDRRDTVAVGIYVDPGIGGHLAQEAAQSKVCGMVAYRSQSHLLGPGEPVSRALMCGPMCALVGDICHPLLQVTIQVGVIIKGKAAQGVAFDIAHPVLDLAFGSCPVGLAGPGADTPVIAEGSKLRVEDRFPALLALDQGAGVVCEDLLRDTAEMVEGALKASDPVPLPHGTEHHGKGSPGEPKRRHEHVSFLLNASNLEPLLPEIDLHLAARRSFKAYRGPTGHHQVLPEGLQRPVHSAKASHHPSDREFLAEDIAIPDPGEEAFPKPGEMLRQQGGPDRP